MLSLSGTLNAKSSMLVWYNVIFIFWVQRLMLWGHIDFFWFQMCSSEVLEQIGVMCFVEMDIVV